MYPPQVWVSVRWRKLYIHSTEATSYVFVWHFVRTGRVDAKGCCGDCTNDGKVAFVGVAPMDGKCDDWCSGGSGCTTGSDEGCNKRFAGHMKLKIRRLGGLPGPLFTGSCSASGFDVCGGLCTVSFSRTTSSLLSGSLTRVSSGKHNGRLSGTDFSGCGLSLIHIWRCRRGS